MAAETPRFPTLDEFATEEWAQRAFFADTRIIVHLIQLNSELCSQKTDFCKRDCEEYYEVAYLDPRFKTGLARILDLILAEPSPYTRISSFLDTLNNMAESWDRENAKEIYPAIKDEIFKFGVNPSAVLQAAFERVGDGRKDSNKMLPAMMLFAVSDYFLELIFEGNKSNFEDLKLVAFSDEAVEEADAVCGTLEELSADLGVERAVALRYKKICTVGGWIKGFIYSQSINEGNLPENSSGPDTPRN